MDHCRNASEPDAPLETVSAPPGAEESRDSQPAAVRELDAWADAVRQRHLARTLDALGEDLSAEDRAAVAACSRALVDAILGRPRAELRAADEPDRRLAALFDIEE